METGPFAQFLSLGWLELQKVRFDLSQATQTTAHALALASCHRPAIHLSRHLDHFDCRHCHTPCKKRAGDGVRNLSAPVDSERLCGTYSHRQLWESPRLT